MHLICRKSFVLLTLFQIIFNYTNAQIPFGGRAFVDDINSNHIAQGKGTFNTFKIDSLSFSKVFKYTTLNDVANAWDAKFTFVPNSHVAAGDVLLVTFFARTASSIQETGEGFVNVCIENKTNYDKILYHTISVGAEWKQYFVPVKSLLSLPINNLGCSFHLGFSSQSIELAEIQFINYNKSLTVSDLPSTKITYEGREPDAEWRAEADKRISQLRKGNVKLIVLGSDGLPIPNANVSISMIQHNFGFGTAITVDKYLNDATYKAKVLEMFNEVVLENDMKWKAFATKTQAQKNQIIQVLDDLDLHQIKMRGHNVLWPSWKYSPPYLETMKTSPEKLNYEINKHIDDICTFTKNRLNDWDVINEPYTEKDFMDVLGKSAMVDWFKRVRANDPNVKLYLNDFAILSSNGINIKKQNAYIETINYINNLGGGVQGIGFQGHFSSDLTPIVRLKSILDKFSALNLDMKITEFDIDITQQQVQADYMRDFLTMMFSHQSIKSVLMWGFWESRHWKPNAAIYNADWTLRPHGEVFRDLVLNKWWTKTINTNTNKEGTINFNGFLGKYKYLISLNGKNYEGKFGVNTPLSNGKVNEVYISLDCEASLVHYVK